MTRAPHSEELAQAPAKQVQQRAVEARLQSYARFGVDLGLDRIEALLSAMGNPQQQVPILFRWSLQHE